MNIKKRWSAVSQVTSFKKQRKRHSCGESIQTTTKANNSTDAHETETPKNAGISVSDPDYVRISKFEYEEIKSRVLAIEKRLSLELDNADIQNNFPDDPILDKVQDAYEKTLHQAEPLSPTTDHLARRLSKELKIRKSSESRVIRSPSARKIGSLRRRSRELERQNAAAAATVVRQQSWHVSNLEIIPKVNLKRGRPNTVQSGLKTPVKETSEQEVEKSRNLRSSSFSHVRNHKAVTPENWTNAEGFFNKIPTTPGTGSNLENCRASIVRLRNQNAGMVLAKAKLFDGLLDSDSGTFSFEDKNR